MNHTAEEEHDRATGDARRIAQVDRIVKEKQIPWLILADGKGFDGPIPDVETVDGAARCVLSRRAVARAG